ncbi:MAG: DNA-directed RNA polymerases I, II, and III subunit RPABC3 [Thelocarpon impressellum]|nr:MAG: DNA-directed RNA polymerases I, II, and III subunit RPABC3 [Thelocarpon impressellum]
MATSTSVTPGPHSSAPASDPTLLTEHLTVTSVNAQKYDRVSRIAASTVALDISLTLDVNTTLYPIAVGDVVSLVLASTLNLDGTKEDGRGWRQTSGAGGSLADMYDYVAHGKVYRFEEGEGEDIKVYVSFGGLLLYIVGPYKKLTPLRIDYVYLLLKK